MSKLVLGKPKKKGLYVIYSRRLVYDERGKGSWFYSRNIVYYDGCGGFRDLDWNCVSFAGDEIVAYVLIPSEETVKRRLRERGW